MVSEKLRIDPHSPAYEAARAEMVEVLRQIGREDSRNGYTQMADDLAVGNLMEVPTWIALALMARAPAEKTEWQPIETAPEEGGFLVARPDMIGFALHGTRDLEKFPESGWSGNPTHWQPLPAPPGTTRAPADLRSALEPFAREADAQERVTSFNSGDCVIPRTTITIGQLRRARAAYAALAPTKEPAA